MVIVVLVVSAQQMFAQSRDPSEKTEPCLQVLQCCGSIFWMVPVLPFPCRDSLGRGRDTGAVWSLDPHDKL